MSSTGAVQTTVETPFAAVIRDAIGVLFVRWYDGARQVGDGRSEAQLHVWYADPAHDAVTRVERWAARRKTSLTISFPHMGLNA